VHVCVAAPRASPYAQHCGATQSPPSSDINSERTFFRADLYTGAALEVITTLGYLESGRLIKADVTSGCPAPEIIKISCKNDVEVIILPTGMRPCILANQSPKPKHVPKPRDAATEMHLQAVLAEPSTFLKI